MQTLSPIQKMALNNVGFALAQESQNESEIVGVRA